MQHGTAISGCPPLGVEAKLQFYPEPRSQIPIPIGKGPASERSERPSLPLTVLTCQRAAT